MREAIKVVLTLALLLRQTLEACAEGCLKCDPATSNCLYCDTTRNYTMWQGTCAITQFPNCELYTVDGMCLVCTKGFYPDPITSGCIAIPTEAQDPNCLYSLTASTCLRCVSGAYLTSTGPCVKAPQPITGCAVYITDDPTKCSLCESKYYLSVDQAACFPKAKDSCLWYSPVRCEVCQTGFIRDINYYVTAILNVTYWKPAEDFKQWSSNFLWLSVPQCRPTTIQNCLKFRDYRTCQVCQPGYILTTAGGCMSSPLPGIPNCATYRNSTICLNCTDGYYLTNSTTCTAITNWGNCTAFNTSAPTAQCVLCRSTYYLNSSLACVPRVLSLSIKNCVVLNPSADACLTCTSGKMTTADGSSCTTPIDNCQVYDTSTGSSTTLVCSKCVTGYSYIVSTHKCVLGTLPNCLTYDKNNVCESCQNNYFLAGSVCAPQPPIPSCLNYSQSTNNTCATCVANAFKFDVSNYCLIYNVILYCATYYDTKSCSKCQDYYYLVGTSSCVKIPTSLNCIQYVGGSCVKCLPNYFLNFGSCQLPSDYQLALCTQNNVDGLISPGQFQCQACAMNAVPINLKGFYTCTDPQGASWVVTGCLKYSANRQGRLVCDRCQPGFYVYSGTCMASCPAGTILYLATFQGFDTTGQSANNNFTITGVNVCDQAPSYLPNCAIATPSAIRNVIDSSNALSYAYTCQKCVDNTIPVVGDSTGNSYTGTPGRATPKENTASFTMPDPIEMHPAFSCVLLAGINVFTAPSTFSSAVIPNCDYYHQPVTGYYCCLRCVFGYSGTVFPVPGNANFGCLSTCTQITDCNTAVTYKGWWRSIETVTVARATLETYISCHACLSSKILTLVLNYNSTAAEFGFNAAIGTSPNPGLAKLYPMPCKFRLPTTPNYVDQLNWVKSSANCTPSCGGRCNGCPANTAINIPYMTSLTNLNQAYTHGSNNCVTRVFLPANPTNTATTTFCISMTSATYLTYPYTFLQAGQSVLFDSTVSSTTMLSCQVNAEASFGVNVGGTYQSPTSNCALYIVNANMYLSSMNVNSATSNLNTEQSVYCGACSPGYRPRDVNTLYRLPFHISVCEAIANCAAGGTWVNFCQTCSPGYVWFYNTTFSYIDYSTCVPLATDSNCQAASVTAGVSRCEMCKRGFAFNPDHVCDSYQIPFCTETTTYGPMYSIFYNANLYYYYLSSQLYYFYPEMPSCNLCKNGYYAVKATVDTIICVTSSYITQRTLITGTLFKSSDCANYYMDTSGNYKCYLCKTGYLAGSDGRCYLIDPNGGHLNCRWALNSTACDVCLPFYTFVNAKCAVQSINLCVTYNTSKTATSQVCTVCASGYYPGPGGSKCLQGNVANCLNYTAATTCSACNQGFQLLTLKNSVSYCIPIPATLKCQGYDFNFQDGAMKCSSCIAGYVNTNSGDYPMNYCLQFTSVPNCRSYDVQSKISQSSFNCTQCATEYYLSPVTFQCLPRTFIDPQCRYLVFNADKCLFCRPGYYIHTDFLTCLPNPTGIRGCLIYQNSTACLSCDTNYYLANGLCVSVGNNTVANCRLYGGPSNCTTCVSGYYVLNVTNCSKSNATNCSVNANLTACAECPSGYGFATDTNNITSCVAFTDVNCMVSSTTYPFTCTVCYAGFAPDSKGVCQQVQNSVTGCQYYEAEGICSQCTQGSILSVDKTACSKDSKILMYLDPNCASAVLLKDPECVACTWGYYFDATGACQPCPNGCALCEWTNPQTCYLCMPGGHMNPDQLCVDQNNKQIGATTTTSTTNTSSNSNSSVTNTSGSNTTSTNFTQAGAAQFLREALAGIGLVALAIAA